MESNSKKNARKPRQPLKMRGVSLEQALGAAMRIKVAPASPKPKSRKAK